jgi:hypothetical protein
VTVPCRNCHVSLPAVGSWTGIANEFLTAPIREQRDKCRAAIARPSVAEVIRFGSVACAWGEEARGSREEYMLQSDTATLPVRCLAAKTTSHMIAACILERLFAAIEKVK